MKLTVMTSSELIVTVDVDPDESVENLKALLEVETKVPIQQQHLLFNGKAMNNTVRLNFLGIRDGDLIIMEEDNESDERNDNDDDETALLEADPFDVESQKKIEAQIRQKGIDDNMKAALEHNPEGFVKVVMLYVDMEVNGVPVKAFVDSGAQITIMSKSCAERCGLLRLVDERCNGIAHGVGKAEILGRIHLAPLKIGSIFYHSSFTVLDSPNIEFLFGLDMLRKHQCVIDLMENVLRVGGGEVSVPFLQEKDIPKLMLSDEKMGSGSEAAPKKNVSVSVPTQGQSSGVAKGGLTQPQGAMGSDLLEGKVMKLLALGFRRDEVVQALKLYNGNEEQAASYLFNFMALA